MKTKLKKSIAALVAFVLIILVFTFANSLVGNPISKHIAAKGIKQYISTTYPNTDYKVDDVGYDFKFNQYYAHIISPSSKDSKFMVSWDKGEVVEDTYASDVAGGMNTIWRYQAEAAAQIAVLLNDIPELTKEDVKVTFDSDFVDSLQKKDFGLDSAYDKSINLPLELTISYNTDTPSLENYATLLEKLHNIIGSNGYNITYYSICNYEAKRPLRRINVYNVSPKQIESGSLLPLLKVASNTDPAYVPEKPIDASLYDSKLTVTIFEEEQNSAR